MASGASEPPVSLNVIVVSSPTVLDAYRCTSVAGFALGKETSATAPAFRNALFFLAAEAGRALFAWSEGPAISAVVARESAALALDLLRRSLSRGLGLAVEEEIEAHPALVLDPKEEILGRLDAEVAHLEAALAAYPKPPLLQADTTREALHALDPRDGQPPLDGQQRVGVLRDARGKRGGVDGLDHEVHGRVAVGRQRLPHLLVPSFVAGADAGHLDGQAAAHALGQIGGVRLELTREVAAEAAEVGRREDRVEGHGALPSDGYPGGRLGESR